MVEATEEVVNTEPAPKKAKKKSAAKKGKAKTAKKAKGKGGSSAPRGRKLYSLVAGVKLDDYDPKTHPGAVVHALRKLGEGTRNDVIVEVEKQGKIETGMELADAVGFVLWDLSIGKHAGVIKTKAAPKKSDSKKAA